MPIVRAWSAAAVQMLENPWAVSVWKSRFSGGESLAPHHHGDPLLCVVNAGGYEERIRGRRTAHGAGHLLYCPPFEPHAQTFSRKGATKILLRPSVAAVEYLQERVSVKEAPFIRSASIAAIGARLAAELRAPDEFSSLIAEGLVAELLGLLGRSVQTSQGFAVGRMQAAREFIDANACSGFSAAQLARSMGEDPVRLASGFRRAFGKSIGEYAREVRLARALEMLTRTHAPLAEISAECGFHDQAHFTRSFSAAYGTTPGRYRRVFQ